MAGCCKKKEDWLNAFVMVAMIACWLSYHGSCNAQQLPSATGLSEGEFRTLVQQLRDSGYYSAATVLNFVTRASLLRSVTLLVPTDPSLSKIATIAPSDYSSLLKCHVLASNLSLKRLRLLPVNTWIPTLLPGYGVEVTSNSANNYSLNGVEIVNADLCPALAAAQISCHGINSILNPASQFGIQPPEFAQGSLSPPNPPTTKLPPSASPAINPPNFASAPPVAPTPLFAFLAPLKSPSPTHVPSPSPTQTPTPTPTPSPTPSPSPTPTPTPSPTVQQTTTPTPSLAPTSPPATAPDFAEAQSPPAPPTDSAPLQTQTSPPLANPNFCPFTTFPLPLHLTISLALVVFSVLHPSLYY